MGKKPGFFPDQIKCSTVKTMVDFRYTSSRICCRFAAPDFVCTEWAERFQSPLQKNLTMAHTKMCGRRCNNFEEFCRDWSGVLELSCASKITRNDNIQSKNKKAQEATINSYSSKMFTDLFYTKDIRQQNFKTSGLSHEPKQFYQETRLRGITTRVLIFCTNVQPFRTLF